MKVIYPGSETHPLHHQYDGDFEPLPAYIEIDPEDDELSAGIGEEQCTPIYVCLGKSYRVSVSAELTHDEVVALMDEIKPLAEKVAEGHSTEWDGSNIVGKLDACAEKALLKIEKICDDRETTSGGVWDAGDYFNGFDPEEVTAETTDEEIPKIVAVYEKQAASAEITLDGLEEYITDIRDRRLEACMEDTTDE